MFAYKYADNIRALQVNNWRIIRITNAKFQEYYFYINVNM